MMQRNINLSIQFPNDASSLLPIHSDVWSGDSPYEINLWLPLVDCFKTKSMYLLNQKKYKIFEKKINKTKNNSSSEIYKKISKEVSWMNIKYGNFLLFNQSLPHGNIVNKEKETRWSFNCRFKSIFTPYVDKKIESFFYPLPQGQLQKLVLTINLLLKIMKLKGYIFSRPFFGERVPQNVQNIILRDYCKKKLFVAFKLNRVCIS